MNAHLARREVEALTSVSWQSEPSMSHLKRTRQQIPSRMTMTSDIIWLCHVIRRGLVYKERKIMPPRGASPTRTDPSWTKPTSLHSYIIKGIKGLAPQTDQQKRLKIIQDCKTWHFFFWNNLTLCKAELGHFFPTTRSCTRWYLELKKYLVLLAHDLPTGILSKHLEALNIVCASSLTGISQFSLRLGLRKRPGSFPNDCLNSCFHH